MKFAIGDLHGRNHWRDINIREYEKIIFLGDYVDSDTLSDSAILENLTAVIELKKQLSEKVVLLLGNHDVQYLHFPQHQITGFRPTMQPYLTQLFDSNRHLFTLAYQYQHYIFTHAGITNSWYKEFLRLPTLDRLREKNDTISDLINKVEQTSLRYLLYAASIYRGGYGSGSFLWADQRETSVDMLQGFHQVVGHSKVDQVVTITLPGRSITYIDVPEELRYFHQLDI